MYSNDKLIKECLKGNKKYQKELYEKYASKMLNLCHRYCRNNIDAEDIMQDGFINVFKKLNSYNGKGSFEGWVRKIMINTAINFYRKNWNKATFSDFSEIESIVVPDTDPIDKLSINELLNIIQTLPDDSRVIFNMFAVEGYNHKEITEILQINENTCRSKLFRARKILVEKIRNQNIIIEQDEG